MVSRMDNRSIGTNATEQYRDLLDERNIKQIKQYFTPKLRHPTAEEASHLELVSYEWKLGDRFYKLANQYYNDPKKWWIIAQWNMKPTEFHVNINETIQIPLPLDRVLELFGY